MRRVYLLCLDLVCCEVIYTYVMLMFRPICNIGWVYVWNVNLCVCLHATRHGQRKIKKEFGSLDAAVCPRIIYISQRNALDRHVDFSRCAIPPIYLAGAFYRRINTTPTKIYVFLLVVCLRSIVKWAFPLSSLCLMLYTKQQRDHRGHINSSYSTTYI